MARSLERSSRSGSGGIDGHFPLREPPAICCPHKAISVDAGRSEQRGVTLASAVGVQIALHSRGITVSFDEKVPIPMAGTTLINGEVFFGVSTQGVLALMCSSERSTVRKADATKGPIGCEGIDPTIYVA